jgi:16S rRNA (cytosine967-C5)-methyltransferase
MYFRSQAIFTSHPFSGAHGQERVGVSRRMALSILMQVEKEILFAAPLLDRRLEQSHLSPLDKNLTTELVYGVLRWQGRLDAILSPLLRFPLRQMDPALRTILRLAVYQLLFLDRIPTFAVVDEAVKMAHGSKRQGDFVNAILRQIANNPQQISPPAPSSDPAKWVAYYSHPQDLIERWIECWGEEESRALMEADNRIPYVGVQGNTLKADASSLQEALSARVKVLEEGPLVPNFFRVQGLFGIREAQPYRDGWFQVMDEASALIPYLVDPEPGEEILDACTGKGAKAAILGQLMENRGSITAVDTNGKALQILKDNSGRLGVSIIEPVWGDVRKREAIGSKLFDKILLDAPCSGLGTLRRHPEIKWRSPLTSLRRLQSLQSSLLGGVAAYLRPGGVMLYSTCSPMPEEGEEVIADFLRSHPSFGTEDLGPYLPKASKGAVTRQGYLRTFPHRHGTDAFFAARLKCCES